MTRRELLALVGGGLVLLAVGGPAAVASYRHAWTVVERSGDPVMAPWLPATTDGLLVAALVVMWVRRFIGRPIGRGPWAAFALGLFATLWANVRAVAYLSTDGERIAVALWGPVALAVTLELLALLVADVRGGSARPGGTSPDRSAADPDRTDTPRSDPRREVEPIRELAVAVPISRDEVDELERIGWADPIPGSAYLDGPLEPTDPADRPVRDPRLTPADLAIVEKIEAELGPGGELPSIRQTRLTYGLGAGRADRILAAVRIPEGSAR